MDDPRQLPTVFSVADLARALGWPKHKVLRVCKLLGVGEKHSREGAAKNGKIHLTRSALLVAAPDVYYALVARGIL